MAEELRLALILLGTLAIGSVILHGIWTVRRTVGEERKNAKIEAQEAEPVVAPEEQEIQRLKLKQMEMNFSELQMAEKGLSSDSIPVKKMNLDSIYNKDELNKDEHNREDHKKEGHSKVQNDQVQHDKEEYVRESKMEEVPPLEIGIDEASELTPQHSLNIEMVDTSDSIKPQFDIEGDSYNNDSYTKTSIPQDSLNTSEEENEPSLKQYTSEPVQATQTAQQETQTVQNNNTLKAQKKETILEPKEVEKQDVFILYIDKSEGTPIDGARLLPLLLTLGFKYGEMDLFHRHQDNAGRGDILFSLANMFNPGTFDIYNMEQVTTRGLTIFMTLPNSAEPLPTFNMMHNAAKKIADEFSAKVLDDQRRPLDVAIVRSYVERIRRF